MGFLGGGSFDDFRDIHFDRRHAAHCVEQDADPFCCRCRPVEHSIQVPKWTRDDPHWVARLKFTIAFGFFFGQPALDQVHDLVGNDERLFPSADDAVDAWHPRHRGTGHLVEIEAGKEVAGKVDNLVWPVATANLAPHSGQIGRDALSLQIGVDLVFFLGFGVECVPVFHVG